jgi:hypothetical protein
MSNNFRGFVFEDSQAEYDEAAQHQDDMAKRSLVIPKNVEPGDLVIWTNQKDWKDVLKKREFHKVGFWVDKNHIYYTKSMHGVLSLMDNMVLKMNKFAKVISLEDLIAHDNSLDVKYYEKDIPITLELLKNKGKID